MWTAEWGRSKSLARLAGHIGAAGGCPFFLLSVYLPCDGSVELAELMSRNQEWAVSPGA